MFLFLSPSTFFGLPLFLFLFLCLSLALVLFFLSSLSLFFLLSFGSFFFSLSHFSFFFAFVFWKEQHAIFKLQFIFSSIFSLFMVSCLVFLFQIHFSYLCFFPGIQLCFLFNINVFGFKKHKLRNTNFWSKGELQQNVFFFFFTCVLKNMKSYRFFCPFLANFLLMFKKHCKNRYFSTFSKAKKRKMTIFQSYYLGQVNVIIWAKFAAT